MDDVRAVMDAVGSKRAAVMGFSEGCVMGALFAATYPERVSQLILFGGFAVATMVTDDWEARVAQRVKLWGTGSMINTVWPSQARNPDAVALVAKFERLSASPGGIRAITLLNVQIDVRPILPTVRVPTLVLHRRGDLQVPIEAGRSLARQIPNARFIEYDGDDHLFCTGDVETLLGDIEEFVTGNRQGVSFNLERILATVLFTDIVDSTSRAVQIGDHSWHSLLDEHDRIARRMVEKYRGHLVKTTGDGILATFDGPGRAIRCALDFEAAATQIGLPSRAGLHAGEVEIRDKDIGGIAVHAAARVMAHSHPGEVLVSRVVMDLVAGAGLKFVPRGAHKLKGVPGRWDLFAASA